FPLRGGEALGAGSGRDGTASRGTADRARRQALDRLERPRRACCRHQDLYRLWLRSPGVPRTGPGPEPLHQALRRAHPAAVAAADFAGGNEMTIPRLSIWGLTSIPEVQPG